MDEDHLGSIVATPIRCVQYLTPPTYTINSSDISIAYNATTESTGGAITISTTDTRNITWEVSFVSGDDVFRWSPASTSRTIRIYAQSNNYEIFQRQAVLKISPTINGIPCEVAGTKTITVRQRPQPGNGPQTEVRIGNVIWAGENLTGDKWFASTATDYGKYFVFRNSTPYNYEAGTAIPWTGSSAGDWDFSGDTNPCPYPWYVPYTTEIADLKNPVNTTYNGNVTRNSVRGAEYTVTSTGEKLFFPHSGYRLVKRTTAGTGRGTVGHYWTRYSPYTSVPSVYYLLNDASAPTSSDYLNHDLVDISENSTTMEAMPVRCVRRE